MGSYNSSRKLRLLFYDIRIYPDGFTDSHFYSTTLSVAYKTFSLLNPYRVIVKFLKMPAFDNLDRSIISYEMNITSILYRITLLSGKSSGRLL